MKKNCNRMFWLEIAILSSLFMLAGELSAKTINVTTVVEFTAALVDVAAGDTVLIKGGTYTIPYNANVKNTITLSKSGTNGKVISVIASNNSRAIIDFSYPDNSKVLNSAVTSYGLEITGSYWYFKGVCVTRAGYQGAYVSGSHITFESCAFYENWNSGLEINKGGSYVTVVNTDSYRNYDGKYKNGSMADGFASKQTQGPGNKFINCRAWENSDDGVDTYDSPEVVTFDNCWAFRNGVNIWGAEEFTGNGNGFKVGGLQQIEKNVLKNCISFGQPGKGFDQNNNMGGITIYNCTSYNNGMNYGFGNPVSTGEKHILKNNISLGASNTIANAIESNNSWSSGFSVTAADFESLDTSLATIARNPDGSLPETKLFRLKSTSTLVNKAVDVGLPFNGSAPDLGAFETGSETITKFKNIAQSKLAFVQTLFQNQLCVMLSTVTNKAHVSIFSLNGVMVINKIISNSKEVTIDCSLLKSGIYLTVVQADGVSKRLKFSK